MESGSGLIELVVDEDCSQITLIVTLEQTEKALNDQNYAKHLVAIAKAAASASSDTCSNSEPCSNSEQEHVDDPEGAPLHDATSSGKWQHPAILLLIDEYKKSQSLFDDACRHKVLWIAVAESINKHGYHYRASQVASKIDSLKRRYRTVCDANKKSGNGAGPDWPYYEASHEIWGERKSLNLGEFADSDDPPSSLSASPDTPGTSGTSAPAKRQPTSNEIYLDGLFARMSAAKAAEEEKKRAERSEREAARNTRFAAKQEFRSNLLQLLGESLSAGKKSKP